MRLMITSSLSPPHRLLSKISPNIVLANKISRIVYFVVEQPLMHLRPTLVHFLTLYNQKIDRLIKTEIYVQSRKNRIEVWEKVYLITLYIFNS